MPFLPSKHFPKCVLSSVKIIIYGVDLLWNFFFKPMSPSQNYILHSLPSKLFENTRGRGNTFTKCHEQH